MSFCCLYNGKIIGTILCGHDGRRGYIYHVTVNEQFRSKGIGSELVSKSLEKLKDIGIYKCHLFVFNDNGQGSFFWSKLEWVKRDDIYVYSKNT